MTLCDDETQRNVVSKLRIFKSLGGVRYQEKVTEGMSWMKVRDISNKPLVEFIDSEMRPFDEFYGVELMELKAVPAN